MRAHPRAIRAGKGLHTSSRLSLDTPDGEAVVLGVVVRGTDRATEEEQAVGVVRIARSRGPVVAVTADIAQRAAVVAAGIREILRSATNLGGTS